MGKLQDLQTRYEDALLYKGPYLTRGGVEVSNWLDSYEMLLCGVGLSWTVDALAEKMEEYLNYNPDINLFAASGKAGALLLGGLLSKWPSIEGALVDPQESSPILYLSGKCILPIEDCQPCPCIVFEDVCSEGTTAMKVINCLRNAGIKPLTYLTVVYRGLGARKLVEDAKIAFDYLIYIPEAVSKDHEVRPYP